tara:strand:- start:1054 stop:1554 length:501 start_codon:yes stop_codon:yes gene_type:complete
MAQQTETQSYDVIEKHDNIEIRYYPPAAKVISKGGVGNANFRNLFNYISGSNSNNEKISMTTPVYMKADKENQIMEFVLPKKFNDKEIPKPVNDNLEIYRSKEGMYASIRYSGYNNNEKQVFYTEKLLNKIKELKKEIIGTPILLSYDSPYKFYNRRNEILMELSN